MARRVDSNQGHDKTKHQKHSINTYHTQACQGFKSTWTERSGGVIGVQEVEGVVEAFTLHVLYGNV